MNDTITIPRKVLASPISQAIGSYPNPDDPMPPGPLDPYIRKALDRMKWVSDLGVLVRGCDKLSLKLVHS
jgi:hypothetical protein